MTISVYIDSCAWNYLYENKMNLEVELPSDSFTIYITREVEIELESIPSVGKDGSDKRGLKEYILHNINRQSVQTSYVFGFLTLESDGTPSPVQVYGGFNVGSWQPQEERDFYAHPELTQQLRHAKKI